MEQSFVAEFQDELRAMGPAVGNEIEQSLRRHRDVPRDTGELANSITRIGLQTTANRTVIEFDALADHANILDKGIKVQPIRPRRKQALASGDGSFGPVASANPAATLNKYRGWWERVFRAVTDAELTALIEDNLGNQ